MKKSNCLLSIAPPPCKTLCSNKNPIKLGFSLAETLITLVIIGIIAVMTIPNLISKYEKKVTVTKLKSTYAILNQALKMSINENGPVGTWPRDMNTEELLKKYFVPYLKIVKIYPPATTDKKYLCYEKDNGNYLWITGIGISTPFNRSGENGTSSIKLPNNSCVGINAENPTRSDLGFTIAIDVNGHDKKPNKTGYDLFWFILDNNNAILPYGYNTNMGNDTSLCYLIKHAGGLYCTLQVVQDNWEINYR